MRLKDGYVIWTVYFDQNIPRSRGRKISKNKAIPKPTLNELQEAARRAGYKPISIRKAKYPSLWWVEDSGYIVIQKKDSKYKAIKEIARELRRIRGGK